MKTDSTAEFCFCFDIHKTTDRDPQDLELQLSNSLCESKFSVSNDPSDPWIQSVVTS